MSEPPAAITNPDTSNTASQSRPASAARICAASVRSATRRSTPSGSSLGVRPRLSTATSAPRSNERVDEMPADEHRTAEHEGPPTAQAHGFRADDTITLTGTHADRVQHASHPVGRGPGGDVGRRLPRAPSNRPRARSVRRHPCRQACGRSRRSRTRRRPAAHGWRGNRSCSRRSPARSAPSFIWIENTRSGSSAVIIAMSLAPRA